MKGQKLIVWGLFVLTFSTPASTQSFEHESLDRQALNNNICVICSAPAKVYECKYDHFLISQTTPNTEPQAHIQRLKGLQFLCIQEIARLGGHAQCAAERRPIKSCRGIVYKLKYLPQEALQSQKESNQIALPSLSSDIPQQPQTTDSGQADNLVDATDNLVKATKKNYQTTANAVKNITGNTQKTVTDTSAKAGKSVKDFMSNTGDKIKGAAQSTYRCMASFFADC